jgi:arginine deiminase
MLEKNLFGTDRVALVHDFHDHDQERMHLDTVFNILSTKDVILLDFHSVPKSKTTNIDRVVATYTWDATMGKYVPDQERVEDYPEFE